jgi:hypothetical protein
MCISADVLQVVVMARSMTTTYNTSADIHILIVHHLNDSVLKSQITIIFSVLSGF